MSRQMSNHCFEERNICFASNRSCVVCALRMAIICCEHNVTSRLPRVIPRRPHDFKWQPSAPVYNRRYGPPTAVTWQQSPCIRGQVSTHWPLLHRLESTDLVHRQWTGGILLAFWLPMCEVCTPLLLRLQKHTNLRARARALSHLWHEHRLTNCKYAWSRGLCGITRTVPLTVYAPSDKRQWKPSKLQC